MFLSRWLCTHVAFRCRHKQNAQVSSGEQETQENTESPKMMYTEKKTCINILIPNLFRHHKINISYLWLLQVSICVEVLVQIKHLCKFSFPDVYIRHFGFDLILHSGVTVAKFALYLEKKFQNILFKSGPTCQEAVPSQVRNDTPSQVLVRLLSTETAQQKHPR